MTAKTAGILALGAIAIGILVGFIVGILSLTHPGEFSATRMLTVWGIFGIISLALFIITGVLKSQEIQLEQTKQSDTDSDDDSTNPAPHIDNTVVNTAIHAADDASANNMNNDVIGNCAICGYELK